jgi:hypothetical protein
LPVVVKPAKFAHPADATGEASRLPAGGRIGDPIMWLNVVVGCAMAYTSPHGRRVDGYDVGSATKKKQPTP